MTTAEPALDLTLYVALLKADRFELVLQKGTELGVARFVPLLTARSIVDRAAGAAKRERWERIIREAAEQSRRGRLPSPGCASALRPGLPGGNSAGPGNAAMGRQRRHRPQRGARTRQHTRHTTARSFLAPKAAGPGMKLRPQYGTI